MENKLQAKGLRLNGEVIFVEELGTIGEETPIKDKNGVQLKVGDLVFGKMGSSFCYVPIAKDEGKYFAHGFEPCFNDDGSYSSEVQIEKVKGCEDIELGSKMPIPSTHFPVLAIQYGEKDV